MRTNSKIVVVTPAAPFDYNRLYGNEKYSLNEMIVADSGFPDLIDESKGDDITSTWSDRIHGAWTAAAEKVFSTYIGDAFWAGVSRADLIKFGTAIGEHISFSLTGPKLTSQVTNVRIVRYTNQSHYPVYRIDLAKGGDFYDESKRYADYDFYDESKRYADYDDY